MIRIHRKGRKRLRRWVCKCGAAFVSVVRLCEHRYGALVSGDASWRHFENPKFVVAYGEIAIPYHNPNANGLLTKGVTP